MLISHQYKFVKIDIPKTGTGTFRENLRKYVDIMGTPDSHNGFYQHISATDLQKKFETNKWDWNDYFKFTLVRNPWKRYLSYLFYFKFKVEEYQTAIFRNANVANTWKPAKIQQAKEWSAIFKKLKFNYSNILKLIILYFPSQSTYIFDKNGKIILDYIGNFETLQQEYINFCDKFKLEPLPLEHRNKGNYTLEDYKTLYSKELIDLVARKESFVINLKHYKFNDDFQ